MWCRAQSRKERRQLGQAGRESEAVELTMGVRVQGFRRGRERLWHECGSAVARDVPHDPCYLSAQHSASHEPGWASITVKRRHRFCPSTASRACIFPSMPAGKLSCQYHVVHRSPPCSVDSRDHSHDRRSPPAYPNGFWPPMSSRARRSLAHRLRNAALASLTCSVLISCQPQTYI